MSVTIKLRRGNSSEWSSNSSIVLASGEPGYEIDTGRFKIGDGSTAWSGLYYASVIPTGLLSGSGINIDLGTNGSAATISVTGLDSSFISDFNEAVDDRIGSGLFSAGTGIDLSYDDNSNSFTVSVTGLISNPTNNRILTSRDSTTTGIDAESNLTFDGSLLSVSGDLIADTGNFDIVQFNTNNGQVDTQGQIGWNDTDGTVDVALTDTAIVHIGEHTLYRIRNTTGDVLYKGQTVYASGIHSNGLITPDLYVADGSIREIRFMGLVFEDVNNNNNGYVINFGHIYNIDTRGNVATDYAVGDETWLDGDILYVHPTGAGKLTKVEPKHAISVAIILDAASNGKIFVRPTSYGHLDDNHDVDVSGVTNGQFLQYNNSTDYWVPSSSGNFTSLQVNGTGVSVSGHTHTSSDITDFNTSVSGLLPTIANSGDNRILTSTGTSTGINAESNATFDGTTLAVSGEITIDNLKLDGNTLSATNTNGNIIVQTNGTGALQRDSGGNARGQYSVDLQNARSANTQVAAGNYSVIGGGQNNTNSGYWGVMGGGYGNSIGLDGFNTIGGGQNNTTSSYHSTVCGGGNNTSDSDKGVIAGGYGNSATGGRAIVICGGYSNTASNDYTVVCGGSFNTSSGYSSVINGGKSNIASGDYSAILAGQSNNDNGHNNVFILGSNITATQANTTFVENLDVASTGDITTLKIDNFYHQNLAVATGLADSDLMIAIIDPTGSPTTEVIQGSVLRSSLLNQPAQLQFRQGTDAERLLITPASGEPIWTTDTQKFYIGDGSTAGGDFVGPSPYGRGDGTQSIVALNTGCVASGNYSVVGGGSYNAASAIYSTVGGGNSNNASGFWATIAGGQNNIASASYSSFLGITVGHSTVGGGRGNTSSGLNSTVGGGSTNTASAIYSTVSGGIGNNASGQYSTVGGGGTNSASGSHSTVIGGKNNLAKSDRSFVTGTNNVAAQKARRASNIIGSTNTITVLNATAADFNDTTTNAVEIRYFYNNNWNRTTRTVSSATQNGSDVTLVLTVIVGATNQTYTEVSVVNVAETDTALGQVVNGTNNIASGSHSTVGGGILNTASSLYSTVGGGISNTASGSYSIVSGGYRGKATRYGENSHASGRFANDGDAQHTILIARRTTTDATANQVLFLNGSDARLTIPAATMWTFEVKLSAYSDTEHEAAWWIFRGGIINREAGSVELLGSIISESFSEMQGISASVVADDTNDALEIRVTGVAGKDIRWVAVVDISQVSYGTP